MLEQKKRRIAEQDTRITEFITRAGTLIQNVLQSANILTLLSGRGYDEVRLQAGMDLRAAAQAGFEGRAAAIAAKRKASSELNAQDHIVRMLFEDFRMIGRAIFTDDSSRSALSMKDYVSSDRQTFITRARAACISALGEPYLSALTEFGYDEAFINGIKAGVDELEALDAVQNGAIQAAVEATVNRNEAYENLYAWVKQFRTIAHTTLRHDPELLKILEV